MRIVSLLPAATEICFALGLGDNLVGVSSECDYPSAAKDIPVVSRALMDGRDTSSETSRKVGETLADGGALYDIEEDTLRKSAPDVIVTQGLCDVCAPSVQDVRAIAGRLPKRPRVVSLDPHTLRDVLGDIERVGQACGVSVAARSLVEELRDRIERVAFLTGHVHERPKVACLEWLDPIFLAGHWVPEMVDLAGGVDGLAKGGEKSRRVDAKELVLAAPEVAILMPCGFHLDRARKEAPSLTALPWWRDLPAARRGRVWIVDGSSYFSRPGPRLVNGLEILAHIIHPEVFPRAPPTKDALPWMA